MRITAIKAQVKNPNRVSVYVDEVYAFSLTHNQLLEQKIHSGLEIDEARLTALKKASDFGKMFDRVLGYVMLRPRSEKEVMLYCQRKQYDPEACQAIIAIMKKRRYLDDRQFTRSWIESRRLTKSISERRLRMELHQKGVTEEIIQDSLGASDYNEQLALRQLIDKKQSLLRFQKDPQKLIAYLARQGFNYDDIKQALSD